MFRNGASGYTLSMVKGWTIMGYTYDADVHCPECTRIYIVNTAQVQDFQAAHEALEFGDVFLDDNEGNEIHPVFASDEYPDDWVCADCGEPI